MRIVLCETGAHVWHASQIQTECDRVSIVALAPEAAWACQTADLAYTRLEDFYGDTELALRAEELVRRSLIWIDAIDRFLQERIPAIGASQFRPARAWSLVLQSWLGEYFRGGLILQRIFERAQPDRVLYWPQEVAAPSWNLAQGRPIFAALLPSVAARCGIDTEALQDLPDAAIRQIVQPATTPSPPSDAWVERAFSRYVNPAIMTAQRHFGSSRLWAEVRQVYKSGLGESIMALPRMLGDRGAVLVIGRGYDLDPVVAVLRHQGVRIDWLDMYIPGTSHGPISASPPLDSALQAMLASLWPEVAAGKMLWNPFDAWGLGRIQRAELEIAHWWHQIIPQLWSGYRRATCALARRRYSAVLAMDGGGETLSGAMVQAATAVVTEIPRIIYQHGSSSRIRTVGWQHFLSHASHFFVYGPDTARLIARDRLADTPANASVTPVGSARLDALRRQAGTSTTLRAALRGSDTRPIILYVPTNFGGPGRIFGEQTGYPDVSYFEIQQRLLGLFKRYPGVRLLYKDFTLPNSSYNPVPSFIRQELPGVMVVHDLPLTRLMWAVDVIVIDHAITALGEVLLTNKRIVVYDPDPIEGLELPDARDLLRRRASVATTPDEFEATVRALLDAGDFSELDRPDDSFLRAYCTHLNDGRSAERAADEVIRMMGRQ